jgi:hypothetical protein
VIEERRLRELARLIRAGGVEGLNRAIIAAALDRLAGIDARGDSYSELAEALGCDALDSHSGRLARASRLAGIEQAAYRAGVSPRATAAIPFLRESFRDDGAEGESVHLVCDGLLRAVKRLADIEQTYCECGPCTLKREEGADDV